MFRKLAILAALLVAGALLSSVFAELATGKPAPIQAAEECATSLSDGGSYLFPDLDEEGSSFIGAASHPFFTEQALPLALAPGSGISKAFVVKQPLFLLFHSFLFYDIA